MQDGVTTGHPLPSAAIYIPDPPSAVRLTLRDMHRPQSEASQRKPGQSRMSRTGHSFAADKASPKNLHMYGAQRSPECSGNPPAEWVQCNKGSEALSPHSEIIRGHDLQASPCA